MKNLKFEEKFIQPILSREKNSTWRLFDDKDLKTGREIEFINKQTGETFAKVRLMGVSEKPFKDLTSSDWEGHEKFDSDKEMYETYSRYYSKQVNPKTPVKIINFQLIS